MELVEGRRKGWSGRLLEMGMGWDWDGKGWEGLISSKLVRVVRTRTYSRTDGGRVEGVRVE